MTTADDAIVDDELFELDTKKHRTKNRTLYIDGFMRTTEHLVATLSNYLFALNYLYENPEHGYLFIFIRKGVVFFMS